MAASDDGIRRFRGAFGKLGATAEGLTEVRPDDSKWDSRDFSSAPASDIARMIADDTFQMSATSGAASSGQAAVAAASATSPIDLDSSCDDEQGDAPEKEESAKEGSTWEQTDGGPEYDPDDLM
eukprot:2316043-Pyramimonas_sp.AAC.1